MSSTTPDAEPLRPEPQRSGHGEAIPMRALLAACAAAAVVSTPPEPACSEGGPE